MKYKIGDDDFTIFQKKSCDIYHNFTNLYSNNLYLFYIKVNDVIGSDYFGTISPLDLFCNYKLQIFNQFKLMENKFIV